MLRLCKRLAALTRLGIPLVLTGCSGRLSALDPAGPSAEIALWLWWGMFALLTPVLIGVTALWWYAMRRDPGDTTQEQAQRSQNHWIIGGGLILPLASITLVLAFGIPAGHKMLPLPPEDGEAMIIQVKAHQWWWQVDYPDTGIALSNELHIPANTAVDIHLTTADVIHSFWVPRLAGKLDTIPGRTNVLRIKADEPGVYYGQCAEFCGLGHAHMPFTVTAHTPEDYEQWVQEALPDE